MEGVAERHAIRRLQIDTADDGRACFEAVEFGFAASGVSGAPDEMLTPAPTFKPIGKT